MVKAGEVFWRTPSGPYQCAGMAEQQTRPVWNRVGTPYKARAGANPAPRIPFFSSGNYSSNMMGESRNRPEYQACFAIGCLNISLLPSHPFKANSVRCPSETCRAL